ncbi:hypothetical protein CPB84DRAFT_1846420 [Gymnopilus junonius]|uniref:Uncharacterized protein n=1 Tax=Gymnopilus junonius TaxID=109634 RepID=A0A9P5TP79_GYMJU|nr:hypothetical protein CPB84DRAFT_1846420 [Gymnopilus junonius]
MAQEDGSAPHLPRDLRPSGFVHPSGGTVAFSSVPTSPLQNTRKSGATRRKKSTEKIVSNTRDATDQENKRLTQQRTPSVETIHTRQSKPKKYTEPAGHETVTSSFTCAGATKQQSNTFLPPSIRIISGLEPHQLCSGKFVKKPDCIPFSKSSASILNVDPFHVANDITTYTSAVLSIDFSDDLAQWDMENIPTIPSLPSPPGSPRHNSASGSTNTTQPTSDPNPFSTPIDDDELLENEIPFPLSRHSKVVLENMGVKKSKTLARSRSISGGIIAHRQGQEPTPNVEPSGSKQRQLDTGLPSPLPLRMLGENAESQSRMHTKKDSWGCVHLGAADLELSIVFPKSAHFEVWDMGDDFPCYASLMIKEPAAFSGMPIALPDVSLTDIRCEDLPLPVPRVKYEPREEYYTSYTGSKIGKMSPEPIKDAAPKRTGISMDNISLEGQWVRTYIKPGVDGIRHSRVPQDGDEAKDFRGWYQKFWVPIPTRLFEKRETRVFHIQARIWMMGDEQRVLLLDGNEDGDVYPLLADTEMTVSHLRKEREMEPWW